MRAAPFALSQEKHEVARLLGSLPVGIITVGILSRVAHTGLVVVDKYLGDALYAAMVYTILRLFWRAAASARR